MPKIELKLFGLFAQTESKDGLVAQVLCRNRSKANDLFSEYYDFDSVNLRELGGLSLSYVQEMKPNVIRFMD